MEQCIVCRYCGVVDSEHAGHCVTKVANPVEVMAEWDNGWSQGWNDQRIHWRKLMSHSFFFRAGYRRGKSDIQACIDANATEW